MDDDIIDFPSTPYYKIGMFLKLLKNGSNFKTQIIAFLSTSDKDLDPMSISNAGDFIMYSRAWFWIETCDITDKEWLESFEVFKEHDFELYLKNSLQYFISHEEYEKCILLKNILEIVTKY